MYIAIPVKNKLLQAFKRKRQFTDTNITCQNVLKLSVSLEYGISVSKQNISGQDTKIPNGQDILCHSLSADSSSIHISEFRKMCKKFC